MSNDSQEGRWIHRILKEAFEQKEKTKDHIDRLMKSVEAATSMIYAAGFCMSEVRDQLSQWRGYADDGFGFAIGFNSEYLDGLGNHYRDKDSSGFGLIKVQYGEQARTKELEAIIGGAESAVSEGAFRHLTLMDYGEELEALKAKIEAANLRLVLSMAPLMLMCHQVKNPAFEEEKEWRLVSSHMDFESAKRTIHTTCDFRSVRDRLVPYREVRLEELGPSAISEIVIGPRNITRDEYLYAFLKKHKFEGVKILRSMASYR